LNGSRALFVHLDNEEGTNREEDEILHQLTQEVAPHGVAIAILFDGMKLVLILLLFLLSFFISIARCLIKTSSTDGVQIKGYSFVSSIHRFKDIVQAKILGIESIQCILLRELLIFIPDVFGPAALEASEETAPIRQHLLDGFVLQRVE